MQRWPQTGLLAGVLLFTLGLADPILVDTGVKSTPQMAPADDASADECRQERRVAEQMADRYRISVDEACRRLRLQIGKVPLMRVLRRDFSHVFGGAWVDHDRGGTLVVALTDTRVGQAEALVSLIPPGLPVEVVSVAYTETELAELAEAIRGELGPWTDGEGAYWPGMGVTVVSVAVHPESNRVTVSVAADDLAAAQERVAARFDGRVAVGLAGAVPTDGACTRSDCDPPLRGGIRLERRDSDRGCTLGFMAHNHATQQSHYAITAGHCARDGEVWQHRDEDIGGVPNGGSLESGRTDAARIHVGGYSSFSPGDGYYIFRDGAAQLYQVHYRSFFGDWVKGDEVCKSGVTTGFSCGPIVTINASCCSNDVQMQVDACSDRGDSGAPMYVPNGGQAYAAGVLQGVVLDNGCHDDDDFWGSHIEYVQEDLDIHANVKSDN